MSHDKHEVIIIGAGLAGLAAAHFLDKPFSLFEKESEPGGKARSVSTASGAVFDFTGHLLHLRQDEISNWIRKLLPDAFDRIERKAAIFMQDSFLHYPFQANFHPLDKQTVKECLMGFVEAWAARQGRNEEQGNYNSFAQWGLETFGRGICEHFLFPYNHKLYCTKPEEMSAEWVSWSVPQPGLESVIDGALGSVQEWAGYNASFLYPKQGGIGILPKAMAEELSEITYDTEIKEIDVKRKAVVSQDGQVHRYSHLINTMPLPRLFDLITGADPELKGSARELRYVNVHNLNLVIERPPAWPWQWLYLPEMAFRCYRIGVSSNITAQLAPQGNATVYTEVSYLPGAQPDAESVRTEVLADLKRIGLIASEREIIDEVAIDLQCAYVVHNAHRARWLPRLHGWLKQNNIISTGRWGAWVYGGMEDAIAQGITAAREINRS